MATYNSERYVRAQLDSLLSQTCGTMKIVVSDDATVSIHVNLDCFYKKNFYFYLDLLGYFSRPEMRKASCPEAPVQPR